MIYKEFGYPTIILDDGNFLIGCEKSKTLSLYNSMVRHDLHTIKELKGFVKKSEWIDILLHFDIKNVGKRVTDKYLQLGSVKP